MNEDAEQEIDRLIGEYPTHSDKWLMLRDAMEWAYKDAAKVCEEYAKKFRISSRGAHIAGHCGYRIKEKLK